MYKLDFLDLDFSKGSINGDLSLKKRKVKKLKVKIWHRLVISVSLRISKVFQKILLSKEPNRK